MTNARQHVYESNLFKNSFFNRSLFFIRLDQCFIKAAICTVLCVFCFFFYLTVRFAYVISFWYNVCDCHAITKGNITYLLTYMPYPCICVVFLFALCWVWFYNTSQETGLEEHLQNYLFSVKWDVKSYLNRSIYSNKEEADIYVALGRRCSGCDYSRLTSLVI